MYKRVLLAYDGSLEGAVALRFRTNSWGGKYNLPDDETVGDDVARLAEKAVRRFDFVLG